MDGCHVVAVMRDHVGACGRPRDSWVGPHRDGGRRWLRRRGRRHRGDLSCGAVGKPVNVSALVREEVAPRMQSLDEIQWEDGGTEGEAKISFPAENGGPQPMGVGPEL